ncbi:MAG: PqqD family protein [Bacilli bacterium]
MKMVEGYVLKEIAGEHLIVATTSATLNGNKILSLNDTGVLLFNALATEVTLEDLLKVLTNKYKDLKPEVAQADINIFLNQLRKAHLLYE